LEELASRGPILVAVDDSADSGPQWSSLLKPQPGVTILGDDHDWTFVAIARASPPVAHCSAHRLTIVAVSDNDGSVDLASLTDDDRRTFWSTQKPQRQGDALTLDLGRPFRACSVAMFLGPYLQGYPRALIAETSLDGLNWQAAFAGKTGGLTIRGAVENPRDVPIRIPLRSAPARFIRLTLLESGPQFPWLVTDVSVAAAE